MNRACELTGSKIIESADFANEDSPARLVDNMREAGNKKSSFFVLNYNVLIVYCLTILFSDERR